MMTYASSVHSGDTAEIKERHIPGPEEVHWPLSDSLCIRRVIFMALKKRTCNACL